MIKIFKTILLGLLIQGSCNAQPTFTDLSANVYDNIKFHDVLFTDIIAAEGSIQEMALLFPVEETSPGTLQQAPNAVSIDQYGQEINEPHIDFVYNSGLEVTFGKETINSDFEIVSVKAQQTTINGVSLAIGDLISNLTINYTICTDLNGNNYVSIVRNGAFCCPLKIKLNSSNEVIEILYFIYT